MPSAWVSLPGPLHSSRARAAAAADRHLLEPVQRLERADQHRRPDPVLLAHGVQERVDAVGEVDVGPARRAVEHLCARRHAGVGMAGRLGEVVGLGLDDAAADALVTQVAADHLAGDLHHGAVVEGRLERLRHSPRMARALASCSCTRARDVPPSEALDSSQAPSPSSA